MARPDSIIFKCKLTSEIPAKQTLFESEGKFAVIALKTGSFTYSGIIKFLLTGSSGILSCSTPEIPIFDGNFWNILVQRTTSSELNTIDQTYVLKVNNIVLDRISNYVSSSLLITGSYTASYNASYNTDANFYIGGTLPTSSFESSSPIVGNVSSLKFYTEVISDYTFQLQSLAENVVALPNPTASFQSLITNLRFEDNVDLSSTSSLYDANLTGTIKNHGTASGFTKNTYEMRYQTDVMKYNPVSLIRYTTQKIFIDPNSASLYEFAESSSIKRYGARSNRVDFIFSPSNIENKNIIKFLNFNIHDYIGSPLRLFNDQERYVKLDNLYKVYRNYFPSLNLNDYINNIKSLSNPFFKNISNFIPARVNFNGGITIEPTLLERTPVVLAKSSSVSNLAYSTIAPVSTAPEFNTNYITYNTIIDTEKTSVVSYYSTYFGNVSPATTFTSTSYSTYNYVLKLSDDITSIGSYLTNVSTSAISKTDKIFIQGVKKKLNIYTNTSDLVNNHFTQLSNVFEIATSSYIQPISNIEYDILYNTASAIFYKEKTASMKPLYDVNYSIYYDPSHVKYYVYDCIGRRRSRFDGTITTGPENILGSNTIDGGKVISITFVSPNTISVVSDTSEKRLKVDGIELDV